MNNILYIISTIVIIASVLVIAYYSIKLLSKTYKKEKLYKENKEFHKAMSKLDNAIMLSVSAINKTMVDKLKAQNTFLQQEREEVFYQTKDRIMDIIAEEDIKQLNPYIKNTDEWINNRIEYYVKVLKE